MIANRAAMVVRRSLSSARRWAWLVRVTEFGAVWCTLTMLKRGIWLRDTCKTVQTFIFMACWRLLRALLASGKAILIQHPVPQGAQPTTRCPLLLSFYSWYSVTCCFWTLVVMTSLIACLVLKLLKLPAITTSCGSEFHKYIFGE